MLIARAAVSAALGAPLALLVIYYVAFAVPDVGWVQAFGIFLLLPITLSFNTIGVFLVAIPITVWAEKWTLTWKYVPLVHVVTASLLAAPFILSKGVDSELLRPFGLHILLSGLIFGTCYWFLKSKVSNV